MAIGDCAGKPSIELCPWHQTAEQIHAPTNVIGIDRATFIVNVMANQDMNRKALRLFFLVTALVAGLNTNLALAQTIAYDDASDYINLTNGENTGSGFLPWVLTATNSAAGDVYGGFFVDWRSLPISTATKVWGIYGNGAGFGGPFAMCYRGMSNALAPNQVFKVKIENNGMNDGTQPYGYVGFCLRSDSNTNFADENIILDPATQFAFYNFGDMDDCLIWDANGVTDSGITWQQLNQGLTIEFYLVSPGYYELVIKDASDSIVLADFPLSELTSYASITTFTGFEVNNYTYQDVYFNEMEVAPVSTVPPIITLESPTDNEIYASGQLYFDVDSLFSTINSNGISLILNGVNETNQMSFSGSKTNLQVTLNPPLQPNVVYNGTIIAADANGNHSTNNFTFNTWATAYDNIYIEASDYNYGGGQFLDNALYVNGSAPEPAGSFIQPNQDYGAFDLLGEQGIDYFINTNADIGANNFYRYGDLPGIEGAYDVDHNDFAENGFQPYDLDYNEYGQWEDYTRELSNYVTYAVYARMSAFGANPTMSLERMATPTVNSANQPGAVLGTFVPSETGGTQNYTSVPLTDFFSNPVLINFGGTNTFRITDVSGSGAYNVSYLLLLAVTNETPLGPYITSGYPFPSATGAYPESSVSFTIANRATSVVPDSIQLFLNGTNLTSSLTLSNNAAGTLVTYQPGLTNLLMPGTNTAEVIFGDDSVLQTDSWQFTVESYSVLPASWALPLTPSGGPGFYEHIAKGDDGATNTDFPPSVDRAVAQLAGALTNSLTGMPYANEALNDGVYFETNTINYAVDSSFYSLFSPADPFPDIMPGTTNNIAMAADMYVQLSAGLYTFDVYSDDGFEFSAGSTPTSTNMILAAADYGRSATATEFTFLVPTNGFYPMQLIYFKSQLGGGGVELYYNSDSGNVLLNDPNTPGSIKVYPAGPLILKIGQSKGRVVLSWADAPGILQSAPAVNGPYMTVPGAISPYTVPAAGAQEYFRLVP